MRGALRGWLGAWCELVGGLVWRYAHRRELLKQCSRVRIADRVHVGRA